MMHFDVWNSWKERYNIVRWVTSPKPSHPLVRWAPLNSRWAQHSHSEVVCRRSKQNKTRVGRLNVLDYQLLLVKSWKSWVHSHVVVRFLHFESIYSTTHYITNININKSYLICLHLLSLIRILERIYAFNTYYIRNVQKRPFKLLKW